jgi:hypothetical protein
MHRSPINPRIMKPVRSGAERIYLDIYNYEKRPEGFCQTLNVLEIYLRDGVCLLFPIKSINTSLSYEGS